MDGLLKAIAKAFSRIIIGSETQKLRDKYFSDAEEAIRSNKQFGWFSAKVAIWQLRRNRRKLERIWGILLDPNFHKAVTTYTTRLVPIVEKIMDEEISPYLENADLTNLQDIVDKAAHA